MSNEGYTLSGGRDLTDPPGNTTSRVELEMSRGWARENPELFTKQFLEFGARYPSETWKHFIDFTRHGFVTFTAVLK